ncbi:MAG: hypothetical protein A3F31_04835 [Candidatus Levybacteria bacterium RIFCSPHIGHO2_12_FULL_38_12]|nr:MAG: hypothetical protein A2770_04520 [Candidatus Levybacteria bacterium RIFCSPHIGHO2_01_FULL_38_12]OGH21765.1 MAG: hypothetical protein A3D75_01070 [Candidatus Levybacteria bacterium RIFCSPHIGHO2_02_FULL_37_18]OGH22577.1 MAG: hypothetical protein A3F31_04835 [Candidatus Levybacteria bacterium RIFCSPHIGHO2_12_FULL_38_12]OGH33386.1 MAG: hypothetical protein A3A47_04020 [Candidatus Levybacteria bacterium RIFCSPLOWO2_01_FULL_37_20]OGH44115.1 MAG: hypothetical protein A3J14_05205 [Candidatus Lev
MKPQDIVFLAVFLLLIIKRDVELVTVLGLLSLFFSMPLFYSWIFFTAERLVWYAAAFFLLSIIQQLFFYRKK